jgi:CHAD domain-containing protein/CYTH domain-containing protein
MARRTPLLDRSTPDAVARIANGYLGDAGKALARLADRKDTEALHDFRVAIRRLRSLLRAYGRWLGRAGAKKVRRRLRDLGKATNAGRDAEVQLEWLEAQREALARGERTGLNWLMKRLRATKRESYTAARRQVRAEFQHAADLLAKRLTGGDPADPPFRETFALLLQQHAADLETRLGAIRGPDDEEDAHQARISAKRLRYLLEPLRREAEGVKALVTRLKSLQDVLGELHDMHVLETTLLDSIEEVTRERAERLRALALAGDTAGARRERRRDAQVGLVALMGRARRRRDALFAQLDGAWLEGRGQEFFREALALAGRADRSQSIPVERERKYLLRALPDAVRAAPVQEIEQGWLPGDRLRERLRSTRDGNGERFHRTVKLGAGLERIEIEDETTEEIFEALWPLTEGCRIAKRRYRVRAGSVTWEVDDFLDRDLVLAEVELPRGDDDVPMPDWLKPLVDREVTGDPAYLNLTLATTPGVPAAR